MVKNGQDEHTISGIVIGFNKIPINPDILTQLKLLNMDADYVTKCLEANRHNNVTTSYYLTLKKYVSEGGKSSYDQTSITLDKSMVEPRRKITGTGNLMIDNFFTKSVESETVIRRKSRDKSRDRGDKENRCLNIPNSVVTSIHTESKRGRISSQKPKINDSFNYCRATVNNRSVEKNVVKRESQLENRISRKYKEKFNQSLVSRSKEKCSHRTRVNSSVNGIKKELNPPILFE